MNITTAVFIVAALFHVTNLYARKTAYIRADVANIRMDAEANSELVARCIMNTKVRVDSAFGEWKNISAGNVKGWIHSSLLSGHFYSAKELADSIRAAESKKDMKKWADRLNTAFPHKEEYHRLLLNTYRDLSDSAGVNMLRYRISNSEEVYIARARFGQIQLLGKINRQGVFETSVSSFCVNHEDYEERSTSGLKARIKESDKKLKQTAMALTGRKWYSVSGTVSSVLFSRFSICPGEMESVTQNREYGQLWSDSTVSRWVSFGEYEGEAFFATSPIGSVKKENLPQQIDTLKARKEICQIERECPGSYTRQPEIDTKSIKIQPLGVCGLYELIAICAMCDNVETWDEAFTGLVDTDGAKVYPDLEAALLFPEKNFEPQSNKLHFFKIRGRSGALGSYSYSTWHIDSEAYFEDIIILGGEEKVQGFNIVTSFIGHY